VFCFRLPDVIFYRNLLRHCTLGGYSNAKGVAPATGDSQHDMHLWQQQTRNIILASASPRRRELLVQMGFTFNVVTGESIDEASYIKIDDIDGSVARLSVAKGAIVALRHPQALVLSADTIVVCDGTVLGKPASASGAREMLRMLSGRGHQVKTAVALTCRELQFCQTAVVCTEVYFRDLSADEIDWYIATAEPFDKAGGYGIQGKAMIFVDKIEGCFYNVVGLPVKGTIDLFKMFDAKGTQ